MRDDDNDNEERSINSGGANSPNGSGSVPPAVTSGNGAGLNTASFLTNAFPPGSHSTPSSAKEILASIASGLGFWPDAILLGVSPQYIDPFYHLKPISQTMVTMAGIMELPAEEGNPIPFCFSTPFRSKIVKILDLGVVIDYSICDFPENSRVVVIIASNEITLTLDDEVIQNKIFGYCSPLGGISSLKITTTKPTNIKIYAFAFA
jgi:hypothetical protein